MNRYWVRRGQDTYGPYTWEQMVGLGRSGTLQPYDEVWADGMATTTAAQAGLVEQPNVLAEHLESFVHPDDLCPHCQVPLRWFEERVDGGPDRRYNDNYQYCPQCSWGTPKPASPKCPKCGVGLRWYRSCIDGTPDLRFRSNWQFCPSCGWGNGIPFSGYLVAAVAISLVAFVAVQGLARKVTSTFDAPQAGGYAEEADSARTSFGEVGSPPLPTRDLSIDLITGQRVEGFGTAIERREPIPPSRRPRPTWRPQPTQRPDVTPFISIRTGPVWWETPTNTPRPTRTPRPSPEPDPTRAPTRTPFMAIRAATPTLPPP